MSERSLIFRLAAVTALCLPLPLHAQTHPRLVGIVRLAQDGLNDSARAEIGRFMTGLAPGDSLYPEALYTSALVAASDEERRLNLRKVMVEHSRSAWADDAILLLAQLDYASGDPGGTVTQITRLMEDYPLSPLRGVAGFWGARAASDLRRGELACRWAEIGLQSAAGDLELANQLRYQQQRCQATVAMRDTSTPPDTARAGPPAPPPPEPPPAEPARQTGYFVQVAALPTEGPADDALAQLLRMNYPALIVQEGGYFKVRAGPFPNRADASAALSRIRAAQGGRPFIVTVR